MSLKVVIIDYGMGNLHTVERKLVRLGQHPIVSSLADEIEAADKIILPGVGHFQKAMDSLHQLNLVQVLNETVLIKKKPILGICLGMQLMAKTSEEGGGAGLGWIDAEVVKMEVKDSLRYKLPHTGWNGVINKKMSRLAQNIPDNAEFYFVHSYHMLCNDEADILHQSIYESTFTSAIEKLNIFGVQYHPEKSHDVGEAMLRNFINL